MNNVIIKNLYQSIKSKNLIFHIKESMINHKFYLTKLDSKDYYLQIIARSEYEMNYAQSIFKFAFLKIFISEKNYWC